MCVCVCVFAFTQLHYNGHSVLLVLLVLVRPKRESIILATKACDQENTLQPVVFIFSAFLCVCVCVCVCTVKMIT